ncbi:uncharacterized protein JCM6883_006259 [Sporobolomyces salmoneus]|uniref:uncharacterized protein n=1 Tax=Sporobolomyces salmoneus TaxID=183962 RepID=UPI00317B09C1
MGKNVEYWRNPGRSFQAPVGSSVPPRTSSSRTRAVQHYANAKFRPNGSRPLSIAPTTRRWAQLQHSLVGQLLKRWKGLESLYLVWNSIEVEALAEPSKLINLQVFEAGTKFTEFSSFTSLSSLTLDLQSLSSIGGHLSDPKTLPSLRALGLVWMDSKETPDLEQIDLSRLLKQIDAICVDQWVYRLAKDRLFPEHSSRILVDVYDFSLEVPDKIQSLASAQHIRIKIYHGRQHAI